jgi:hypothetical protein
MSRVELHDGQMSNLIVVILWWLQWAALDVGHSSSVSTDGPRAARTSLAADTVRGLVYDSLLAEPLAGALVKAMPGGETVVSDSAGRFVLVSARPVEAVQAIHTELDQIGLGELHAVRARSDDPRGDATRDLVLATPSRQTIWRQLCGLMPLSGAMGGIVYGTVRDGDGRTLLSGAAVDLQWESLKLRADTVPRYEARTTHSDTLGQFVFCGVQEFGQAGIAARADARQSGNVLLYAEARPVRRVDLVVGAANAPAVLVQGTIQDEQGNPVRDASVEIDGVEQAARTDTAGAFTLVGVPIGSRMIAARKVGLLPTLQVVDVLASMSPLSLLMERGVSIEGVTVTARRTVNRTMRDLLERKRAGFATFLDSTKVMQFPRTQSVLRMVPSISVYPDSNGFDFIVAGRLNCGASIYIDGVKVDSPELASLPMEDIAVIETYGTDTFAPPQFRSFTKMPCAVVLVWTKHRLRP